MDIFDTLTMLGGLALFLFGMSLMGQALERRAGGKLRSLLDKMTGKPIAGFLTGLGVTAVIQSSSATTVMVVGFVNSGLMTLRQSISVIMGANVGTTVTAWLLSLGDIDGTSVLRPPPQADLLYPDPRRDRHRPLSFLQKQPRKRIPASSCSASPR